MSNLNTFAEIRANLDGAAISTYAAVMLIVPLRMWCRTNKAGWAGLGWDDALTFVALIFDNAFFYNVMIGTERSSYRINMDLSDTSGLLARDSLTLRLVDHSDRYSEQYD
jgi:hypothetical protein